MKNYPLNILLIDDDDDDCMLLHEALQKIDPDFKFHCLTNPEEVIQYLHQKKDILPDIIFLDLNMPFRNGLETLADIRSDENFNKIPIAIYSTSNQPDGVKAAFDAGATYYLVKPGRFEVLIDRIKLLFSLDHEYYSSQDMTEKFKMLNGMSKFNLSL